MLIRKTWSSPENECRNIKVARHVYTCSTRLMDPFTFSLPPGKLRHWGVACSRRCDKNGNLQGALEMNNVPQSSQPSTVSRVTIVVQLLVVAQFSKLSNANICFPFPSFGRFMQLQKSECNVQRDSHFLWQQEMLSVLRFLGNLFIFESCNKWLMLAAVAVISEQRYVLSGIFHV